MDSLDCEVPIAHRLEDVSQLLITALGAIQPTKAVALLHLLFGIANSLHAVYCI